MARWILGAWLLLLAAACEDEVTSPPPKRTDCQNFCAVFDAYCEATDCEAALCHSDFQCSDLVDDYESCLAVQDPMCTSSTCAFELADAEGCVGNGCEPAQCEADGDDSCSCAERSCDGSRIASTATRQPDGTIQCECFLDGQSAMVWEIERDDICLGAITCCVVVLHNLRPPPM